MTRDIFFSKISFTYWIFWSLAAIMLSLQYISLKNPRPWSVKESCFSRNSRFSCKVPRKLVPLEEPVRSSRQTTLHLLSASLLAMPRVGCTTDLNAMERHRGFHNASTNSATGCSFVRLHYRKTYLRSPDWFLPRSRRGDCIFAVTCESSYWLNLLLS